jgi:hypothetical protein
LPVESPDLNTYLCMQMGLLAMMAEILGLVFWLAFTVGAPLQELLDTYMVGTLTDAACAWLAGAPAWLSGLVVGGIIGGGSDSDHLPPHRGHLLCRAGLSGGRGLHGPRCLCDRPLHALMGHHG